MPGRGSRAPVATTVGGLVRVDRGAAAAAVILVAGVGVEDLVVETRRRRPRGQVREAAAIAAAIVAAAAVAIAAVAAAIAAVAAACRRRRRTLWPFVLVFSFFPAGWRPVPRAELASGLEIERAHFWDLIQVLSEKTNFQQSTFFRLALQRWLLRH